MLYWPVIYLHLFQNFRGLGITLENALESSLHFDVYYCLFNIFLLERGLGVSTPEIV